MTSRSIRIRWVPKKKRSPAQLSRHGEMAQGKEEKEGRTRKSVVTDFNWTQTKRKKRDADEVRTTTFRWPGKKKGSICLPKGREGKLLVPKPGEP